MQQNNNFNDFIVERHSFRVVFYKARQAAIMDVYFKDHREIAVRFLENTFEIIQNNKEMTQRMKENILTGFEILKYNFPQYEWIDDLIIIKALKEDYDETRS